jgi:hypothetical protein
MTTTQAQRLTDLTATLIAIRTDAGAALAQLEPGQDRRPLEGIQALAHAAVRDDTATERSRLALDITYGPIAGPALHSVHRLGLNAAGRRSLALAILDYTGVGRGALQHLAAELNIEPRWLFLEVDEREGAAQ